MGWLTRLPVPVPSLTVLSLPVGIAVVVGHGHVLQAVVLGGGSSRVGQGVRGMGV